MKMKLPGLFRKKDPVEGKVEQQAETAVKQSVNPYLNAQRTWNDHVGKIMSSRQMWQVVAWCVF
ncbi:MAG: hypothetical protein ACLQBD_24265 [Syntrophobacteraceae bacterium]